MAEKRKTKQTAAGRAGGSGHGRKPGGVGRGASRKLGQLFCILLILFFTGRAISTEKASAAALLLLLSAAAVCALLFLTAAALRERTSAAEKRRTRSPGRRPAGASSGAYRNAQKAREPLRSSQRRSAIDIPMDDVPVERPAVTQTPPVEDAGLRTEQDRTEDRPVEAGAAEAAYGSGAAQALPAAQSRAQEPAYKIVPPEHNPEAWRAPNTRIVVWPDGRVEPASRYAFNYETAAIEQTRETAAEPEETEIIEPADRALPGKRPVFDFETASVEPETAPDGVWIDLIDALQRVLTARESASRAEAPEKERMDGSGRAEEPKETAAMDDTESADVPEAWGAPETELPEQPKDREAPESLKEPEEPARPEWSEQPESPQTTAAGAAAELGQEKPGVADEYRYPPIELLEESPARNLEAADTELRENAARLDATLGSFGVDAAAGEAVRGPSVTRYEFTLEPGVKLSKLTNLQDDIALALGASGVRIAPIPDKQSVVGVEVPNRTVSPVSIRALLESPEFTRHASPTAFAVGEDISGRRIIGDISRFPHVLIAGTTGSGKSVCTNSLIVSMLYKSTPEEVRFIMVDPKMVELAPYNGIPHLLIPVVTDPKKAAGALQWAVYEMMKRYKLFSERGVKDLAAFNALAEGEPDVRKLPTVVVVIDELADLMLIAAKEVEESICRVAQMGRAAGMHLVIATQSPRADVITGLMKANIPSRIAFAVASGLESRIILDNTGAEKLVGKGDMLYAPLGQGKPQRVQGCFISAAEIERVVSFLKANGEADYDGEVIEQIERAVAAKESERPAAPEEASADDEDELFSEAVEVILESGQASTSMLQRRLKLGYSRAARIVDQMEERGVIGPFEGSRPRKILITRESWEAGKASQREMD